MGIWLKKIVSLVFCAAIWAAAFWVMAFGGAIFCCAAEGFWTIQQVTFGILPILAGIGLTVYAWRLLTRQFLWKPRIWVLVGFLAFTAAVFDVVAFVRYRQSVDDSIEVAWDPATGLFQWGRGSVQFPIGFQYARDHGMDTMMGHFTSPDGNLVVEHDIGEFAGEHDGMGGSETLTEGSRVRLGRSTTQDSTGRKLTFVKVSFPDSGCATFYLRSSSENDVAAIEFLARSFRPKTWKPAWLWPLLPEIIRSDCRHRFRSAFD